MPKSSAQRFILLVCNGMGWIKVLEPKRQQLSKTDWNNHLKSGKIEKLISCEKCNDTGKDGWFSKCPACNGMGGEFYAKCGEENNEKIVNGCGGSGIVKDPSKCYTEPRQRRLNFQRLLDKLEVYIEHYSKRSKRNLSIYDWARIPTNTHNLPATVSPRYTWGVNIPA